MTGAEKVMAVFDSIAGEKEKTSSGAVGSGNYISVNKYYGMNGYAYCGTTIRYCVEKAGLSTFKACSNPAYVPTIRQFMDAQGWKLSDKSQAKAGDIFVYSDDIHVGFVYEKYGNSFITAEGNSTVYATVSSAKSNSTCSGAFEGIGYKKRTLTESCYKVYRPTYDGSSSSSSSSSSNKTNNIKTYQTWLNKNYSTGLAVDGAFGPLTKQASIKALQTWFNKTYSASLDVNGKWSDKLSEAFKKVPNQAVDKGDTGASVYILQGLLFCYGYSTGGFDGEFGMGTYMDLCKYQGGVSLTADGEAGAKTFYKMTY